MDFHLKHWRNQQQHESEQEQEEEQPSVKMPKLLLDSNNHQSQYSSTAPLPLFVPEPSCKISHLSAFSDSTQLPASESESPAASSNTTRSFPKMGGGRGSYFSWAQRQELELQALIYKYMEVGAAVPLELLQPIKKSLLHSYPYFLHHPLQHYSSYYQPALLQAGYWGRGAMDPEPGRCRRTDGKKWRCSRDVVAGQKYCERHVHRGRNRSRKPVEIPTPTSSANTAAGMDIGGGSGAASGGGSAFNTNTTILAPPLAAVNNGNSTFCFTGQSSSTQFLHHNNNGPSDTKTNTSDGRILRHFFDDWPRSESDSSNGGNSQMNTATCLSISMPGNTTSDVSLKLATGDGAEERGNERELQPQLNWNGGGGWGTAQVVASMGGPLAEALRSSTSNSSPTSVLHHLPRASASETSFVSA